MVGNSFFRLKVELQSERHCARVCGEVLAPLGKQGAGGRLVSGIQRGVVRVVDVVDTSRQVLRVV